MTTTAELVRRMYAAYNRRDADGLLALLTDDVDWPDGDARMRGKDSSGTGLTARMDIEPGAAPPGTWPPPAPRAKSVAGKSDAGRGGLWNATSSVRAGWAVADVVSIR